MNLGLVPSGLYKTRRSSAIHKILTSKTVYEIRGFVVCVQKQARFRDFSPKVRRVSGDSKFCALPNLAYVPDLAVPPHSASSRD